MSFFANGAINRVNLHAAIQAFARGMGGVFFFVALLRAGVTIPEALIAQTGILALRFLLRPAVLPLAIRFGVKPLLIAGALGLSLQYLALGAVEGVGPGLILVCAAAAVGEVLYWLSYNTYFSAVGDAEHRGHQIGAREAMVALASVIAPLIGASLLLTIGAQGTFAIVALVQVMAALPLFAVPNYHIAAKAQGAATAGRLGFLFGAADGVFDASFFFVWQIALFVSLKESVAGYGGAMALAGLAGAVFSVLLGRSVDRGHGARAALLGYDFAGLIVCLQAASFGSAAFAVFAHTLGALAMPLLIPPLVAATSNLAKASPCPFRFHMATEGGWDVGCGLGCLAAAAIALSGASLALALLMGLPSALAGYHLLARYYRERTASP